VTDDPFEVLGLPPTASADQVQLARRRLAKLLHPDLGGDVSAMARVNQAAEQALTMLAGAPPAASFTNAAPTRAPEPRARSVVDDHRRGRRVVHDPASFTIEALPAEAFEALVVVGSWVGDVIDDDPPYVLELHLHEPAPCWCRLELIPDAGASTVNLAVASAGSGATDPPDIDAVRDMWVDQLNQLVWDDAEPRLS
jgi:hypothetical protein